VNILLLVPSPHNISPSQRFRFEHYIGSNNTTELKFTEKAFFTPKTWAVLHKKNHFSQKIRGIFVGFIKRFFLLFTIFKYDFVFIHREAAPIGPPVFEWLISKVFRKKIIYDFDDAIWISAASDANPGVDKLKCTWKVKKICGYSTIVSVGNNFLGEYAKQYCNDVRVIPTVVNTETQHNRLKNHDDVPLCIGWTGTFTNFYNLQKITGIITELKKKHAFTFLIIADKDPEFKELDYVFQKWNVHSEIDDLLKIHIGLMPLENSEIEMGKCAFKAIQYMSLGIPPVASPVGANRTVVENEITGFWADNCQEWYRTLETLLTDKLLRERIGIEARQRIIDHFSVSATKQKFFNLFLTAGKNDTINLQAK
jgi:glycosyltransferase involved in cell wall biosynthesis